MCKKRHFAAGHRVGLGFFGRYLYLHGRSSLGWPAPRRQLLGGTGFLTESAPLFVRQPSARQRPWIVRARFADWPLQHSRDPILLLASGTAIHALGFVAPTVSRAASFGLRIRFLVSPRLLVPPLGALASHSLSTIYSEHPAQRKLPRCSLERLKRTSFRWDPRPHVASLAATACRTRSFLLEPHVPAHRSATGRNIASPTWFTLLPTFDHTSEFRIASSTPHSAPAWSLLRPHAPTTGLA